MNVKVLEDRKMDYGLINSLFVYVRFLTCVNANKFILFYDAKNVIWSGLYLSFHILWHLFILFFAITNHVMTLRKKA